MRKWRVKYQSRVKICSHCLSSAWNRRIAFTQMSSFHLHCIMRINKLFSESGRMALAVAYYAVFIYKLLQLTETLCVEMDYYKRDAHSTCSHIWHSFITPVGSMTSQVRASITFYVEYRKSDICCFRGVILSPYNCSQTSSKVFNIIFCCFITIFRASWPRVPANSVTVTSDVVWDLGLMTRPVSDQQKLVLVLVLVL